MQKGGEIRDSNPGPLAPKASIIPLEQFPNYLNSKIKQIYNAGNIEVFFTLRLSAVTTYCTSNAVNILKAFHYFYRLDNKHGIDRIGKGQTNDSQPHFTTINAMFILS